MNATVAQRIQLATVSVISAHVGGYQYIPSAGVLVDRLGLR